MRRALSVALGAVLASAPASAIETPPTAESAATTVPTLLTDSAALTYAFPSAAADLEPGMFAYGAAGLDLYGLEADSGIRLASGIGSVWYQSVQAPSALASRTANDFDSAISQAGWTRSLGSVRLGASFAWSTDAERRRDARVFDEVGEHSEDTHSTFDAIEIRQGAFGIGWSGSIDFDLSVDIARESFRHEEVFRYLDVDLGETRVSRENVRSLVRSGARLGGGLRLIVPLRPNLQLRVAGTWRDTGNEFQWERFVQSSRNGIVTSEDRDQRVRPSRGDEIQAGASLERSPAPGAPTWSFYVWYERVRAGWRYSSNRPDSDRFQTRTDHIVTGGSIHHPGPRGIEFLGGLAVEGRRSRDRRERYFLLDDRIERSSDHEQTLSFHHAWGARRSFREIELIASVRLTVPATDPLAALDLRIPF